MSAVGSDGTSLTLRYGLGFSRRPLHRDSGTGPGFASRLSRPGPLTGDTLASLVAIMVVGGSMALHGVVIGRVFGDVVLGHAGLALAVGLGVPQLAGSGLVPAITRFTAARRAAGDLQGMRRAALGGLLTLVGLSACAAVIGLLTRAAWAPRIGLPAGEVAPALALAVIEATYIGLKAFLYGMDRAKSYARFEALAGVGFLVALAWLSQAPAESRPALVTPFLMADSIFVLLAAPTLLATAVNRSSKAGGVGAVGGGGAPQESADWLEPAAVPPRGMGMGAYAAHASIGTGASIARLRLVPIVLGLTYGAAEVGLLQAALVFFGPVLLIPRAVELALFPALAGAHGRGDTSSFGAQAAAATRAIALGLALVAGGLIIAGPAILVLAFGQGFEAAAGPLSLVILAAWSLGLAVPAIVALAGADGIKTVNLSGILGLVVSLVAWAILVPPYGAFGAAAGLALGSVPTAVVPLRAAAKRYGFRWRTAAVVTVASICVSGALAWAVRGGGTISIVVAAAYSAAVLLAALPRLRERAESDR